jgi:hypothetical protein
VDKYDGSFRQILSIKGPPRNKRIGNCLRTQETNRDFGWRNASGVRYPKRVIDIDDIRSRFVRATEFLDERGQRLFAANEALAHGYGGVTATAAATGFGAQHDQPWHW